MCNQITEELRTGPLLEGLTLVLTAGQRTQLDDWNTALGGTYQVLIDYDAAVANRLGIEGSPAAIGIADGHLEFGAYLGGLGALNRVLADRNRFVAGNTAQHGTEVRSSPSGEFS